MREEKKAVPAAVAGPSDESAAYQQWFQGEQGKPYQGMWEFARAAWMARAAAPTTQDAPQPAAQQEPVALPFAIFDDEMDALRRFDEYVRDGQGYDVPKAMMRRLSEIGLVRRITANVYEHTDFGCSVLNGDFNSATSDQPQQAAPVAQGDALTQAARDVLAEVERATRKFPTWPTDPLHALAVLGEEFGELTKDMLQMTYEPHKTNKECVRTEAMQTAAMALRLYMSLERYEYKACEQHSQAKEGGA